MRSYIFILLLTLCPQIMQAQDLIIRTNGDSIPCRIKEVGQLFITYHYNNYGKVDERNMASKDVRAFYYGVLPTDSIFLKHIKKQNNQLSFQVAGVSGIGYLTAPLPENIDDFYEDYLNELRLGRSYALDAAFYFNENSGVGMHYGFFKTSNYYENVIVFTPNDTLIGPLSDNISLHYIAPGVFFRFGDKNNKITPSLSAGIGYSRYENNGSIAFPFKIEAESYGMNFYGMLDFNLTGNWALRLKSGFLITAFRVVEFTDQRLNITRTIELEQADNNTRFDLQVGLRYKFGNN